MPGALWRVAAVLASVLLVAPMAVSAERSWQTGTWVSAGLKRDVWTGAGRGGTATIGPGSNIHDRPEVGIYVIETAALRIELQDIVPIGTSGVEAVFAKGAEVTFALEKSMAYVKGKDGAEYRLRVTRKLAKGAK